VGVAPEKNAPEGARKNLRKDQKLPKGDNKKKEKSSGARKRDRLALKRRRVRLQPRKRETERTKAENQRALPRVRKPREGRRSGSAEGRYGLCQRACFIRGGCRVQERWFEG